MAQLRGTKVELISSAMISTVFAEVHQWRKAMQADDGEEASQPSSPTAASVSQSCVACAGLIRRDWPRRFQYCWLGWPATEEAASTWGKTKWACSVAAHRWNFVRRDDLKVHPTAWSPFSCIVDPSRLLHCALNWLRAQYKPEKGSTSDGVAMSSLKTGPKDSQAKIIF